MFSSAHEGFSAHHAGQDIKPTTDSKESDQESQVDASIANNSYEFNTKRILLSALAVGITFFLVSCGSGRPNPHPQPPLNPSNHTEMLY
ncbi:MAG: hypothetical protein OHK0017_11350 [Patescibacteria group bacterium]